MQVGNTSERPEQAGCCRITWKHHVRSPGTSLAGSCKQTSYIPLCNKSPYHRHHRTSSHETTVHTSHNATPAQPVMAIKTSPYPQCKGGTSPDSAPHRPPSVAHSGHVNHAHKPRPLSICLQNQPAMTGKAETMPDISAERRVSNDNVLTRRDPQPRFYTVHSATCSGQVILATVLQ